MDSTRDGAARRQFADPSAGRLQRPRGTSPLLTRRAIPQPRGVACDPQKLVNERRYEVPATVIACEFPSAQLQEWVAQGHPYVAELGRMKGVEYVDLPTGHWPQFTRPRELGEVILAAVEGTQRSAAG